jgi:hypothetical protein
LSIISHLPLGGNMSECHMNEMGPLNFQFCSRHKGIQVGSHPKTDKQHHRNLKQPGCWDRNLYIEVCIDFSSLTCALFATINWITVTILSEVYKTWSSLLIVYCTFVTCNCFHIKM